MNCVDQSRLSTAITSGRESLIFLRDLIDGSPEPDGDRQVIQLVRELLANSDAFGLAEVTVLRGNHEQKLLDAQAEDEPDAVTDLLPFYRKHCAWFRALPHTEIRND